MADKKLMLPNICILGKDPIPDSGTYYLVTGNGIFLHKENGVFEATVRVPRISALPKMESSALLKIPKLPVDDFGMVVRFFWMVAQIYYCETTILIFYDVDNRNYLMECPLQMNDAGSSESLGMRVPGYRLIGSIHSHPYFDAFHSLTDKDDEDDFDGIHIVVGDRLDQEFSIAATLVVNGNRFPLKPEDVIEGIIAKEIEIDVKPPTVKKARLDLLGQPGGGPAEIPIEELLLETQLGYAGKFLLGDMSAKQQSFKKKEIRYGLKPHRRKPIPADWLERVSDRPQEDLKVITAVSGGVPK